MNTALDAQHLHLAHLLEAIQRCVYFLECSRRRLVWPLSADYLVNNKKNVTLFETLAAINERFAKLQDTLGAAMRHAIILAGEPQDTFLKVLAFYEKSGIIDSIGAWQLYRVTRNLAAHEYETDYGTIAAHFNALQSLIPGLYRDAARFSVYCQDTLGISPAGCDFSNDFETIIRGQENSESQ
jgi:hypothetical protein